MESTTRRIVMALCHVIAEADEWEDIAVASRALAKFVEAERLETEYRHKYWSGVREPGADGPDGGDGGGRFGRI